MVDPVDARTAFELCLIQQRKDKSRITGLAVDNDGLRFYVGLDTGFVEEHKVVYGPTGCISRVCAKRQASKKPIKSVCLLGGASILAVLIEDGQLLLCDLDQLEPVPLAAVQGATRVATDPRYLSPCRFAVAVRSGLRKSRVDVFEVAREGESSPVLLAQYSVPEDIKGMAWLSDDIIISSKHAYYVIRRGRLEPLLEPDSNLSALFIALPIPGVLGLLWEDYMAVVIHGNGTAARPPLAFDSKPILLTQGGMCIVSVLSIGGIMIHDQKTSKLVQRIPFNIKNLMSDDDGSLWLNHADTPSGSTILLASAQCVWMLRPVAHEAQTVQLLKGGSIESAIELAEACITESWAEDVFAQAGLLLIQGRKWKFALECFKRCSPSVFQPSQLFPLFPKWTKKWAGQVILMSFGGQKSSLRFLLPRYSRGGTDPGDPDVSIIDHQEEKVAQTLIADYLAWVREKHHVDCIEGVDTLIVHLLSTTSSLERLEAFVQSDHTAELEDVRIHLSQRQQFMALALLCWTKGQSAEALRILRDLVEHNVSEVKAKSGSVREANGKQERAALYYTAEFLRNSQTEATLVEENLRWIVNASPARFLYICQSSSLLPVTILKFVPEDNRNLKFRYLHHLVHTSEQPTQEGHYHTKLAMSLCELLRNRRDFDGNEKLPFMFAADDDFFRYPDCRLSESQRTILNFETTLKPRLVIKHVDRPRGYFEPLDLTNFTGQDLRNILQHHLLLSKGYDAVEILNAIEGTELFEEQVILLCRLQDHVRALRLLSINLRDIKSAIRYCKVYAGAEGFIKLLDMLLNPGGDLEPFFSDAVQVLNAEGGSLDPMRVLDALSETMPLSLAYPTLARMLRERTHRKRQTQITHSLHRLQNVLYRAEKYNMESGMMGRVYVDAESECALCRKPLSGRIFYRYPSGATVCGMCQRERQ